MYVLEGPLELKEMQGMNRVRKEVEAHYKACGLPDGPDDVDDDEGFKNDQFFCD